MLEGQIRLLNKLIDANARQNKAQLDLLQLQTTSKLFSQHMGYSEAKTESKNVSKTIIASSPLLFKRIQQQVELSELGDCY